jgi:hypothetical protein
MAPTLTFSREKYKALNERPYPVFYFSTPSWKEET